MNALQHLAGMLAQSMSGLKRARMVQCLEEYQVGRMTFDASVAYVRELARARANAYIATQSYLRPDIAAWLDTSEDCSG